jgi:hypothetical protein
MNLNILLICNKPKESKDANTISDHILAFEQYSNHNIHLYSNLGDFHENLDLNCFDAIIIHYSIYLMNDYYLSPEAKKKLAGYRGLKILFVQDEYRCINRLILEINKLQFDVYFTCFPEDEIQKVYPQSRLPRVSTYNNLTGYIPDHLLNIKLHSEIKDRSIDVIYRSRKVPFWLGQLGYEKWSIVDKWFEHTKHMNLKVDLSYQEHERLYGEKWISFLASSKAALGVESGASVFDFTGKIQKLVERHQQYFPKDSFQKVQEMYFSGSEGQFKLNQISPRCFEAAALKTALVLYEGEYSGVLIPHRHFIPLKKDFSNIQGVVNLIKDNVYLQEMVDITYQEIVLNPKYHYKSFINKVDNVITAEFIARNKTQSHKPIDRVKFNEMIIEKNNLSPKLILESALNNGTRLRRPVKDYKKSIIRLLKGLFNRFRSIIKRFIAHQIKLFYLIRLMLRKLLN